MQHGKFKRPIRRVQPRHDCHIDRRERSHRGIKASIGLRRTPPYEGRYRRPAHARQLSAQAAKNAADRENDLRVYWAAAPQGWQRGSRRPCTRRAAVHAWLAAVLRVWRLSRRGCCAHNKCWLMYYLRGVGPTGTGVRLLPPPLVPGRRYFLFGGEPYCLHRGRGADVNLLTLDVLEVSELSGVGGRPSAASRTLEQIEIQFSSKVFNRFETNGHQLKRIRLPNCVARWREFSFCT